MIASKRRFAFFETPSVAQEFARIESAADINDNALSYCKIMTGAFVNFANRMYQRMVEAPNDLQRIGDAMLAAEKLVEYREKLSKQIREAESAGRRITLTELEMAGREIQLILEGSDKYAIELLEDVYGVISNVFQQRFAQQIEDSQQGGTDVTPQVKAMDDTIPMVTQRVA